MADEYLNIKGSLKRKCYIMEMRAIIINPVDNKIKVTRKYLTPMEVIKIV